MIGAAQRRAEQSRQDTYAALYGDAHDDAQYLRRRGWIVTAVKGSFVVGGRTVDRTGLAALVARERRLAAPVRAL
jgi:hypothetical protein